MRQMVNTNHSDHFQEENELTVERHHKILAVLVTPNLIMSLASPIPVWGPNSARYLPIRCQLTTSGAQRKQ